jgi:Tol biopolymer transport system component
MQIWRMRADGRQQTHAVKEEANCWFPHVSPDGKWVVYVAYGKDDVAPAEAINAHVSPGSDKFAPSEANAVIAKFRSIPATLQQSVLDFLRSL